MWLHLVPFVVESASTRPAAGLISRVQRLSPTELRRHLLGYYLPAQSEGVERDVIDRAVHGNGDAVETLLRHRTYFDGEGKRLSAL